VVVWPAFQFVARARWRTVRRGAGGFRSLVLHHLVGARQRTLWQAKAILWKVIVPNDQFAAGRLHRRLPVHGFVIFLLPQLAAGVTVNRTFGKLQLLSGAYMGFAHGTERRAQKTMGIITLALVVATKTGLLLTLRPAGWRGCKRPRLSRRISSAGRLAVTHLPTWVANLATSRQPLIPRRNSSRRGSLFSVR